MQHLATPEGMELQAGAEIGRHIHPGHEPLNSEMI